MRHKSRDMLKLEATTVALLALFASLLLWYLYLLETAGNPLAVVASWSMDPTLHIGDIVVVRKPIKYTLGDIVLYQNICSADQKIIVHRIVGIGDGTYVLKGDANPFEDACMPSERDIFGKVEVVVPYLGALRLMFEKLFLGSLT
jgi:signal peptidase I, archaeal type